MNTSAFPHFRLLLLCASICFLGSCGSHKDTATSRAVQNLTARYNYIYNANLILKQHQAELINLYPENYDEILNIYPGPRFSNVAVQPAGQSDSPLDEIIQKSQTIIADKSYSNYLDDAYLLIGKANYYKNNFYNSTEYFDYISKAYKSKLPVHTESLSWKALSLMQLSYISQASDVVDTLKKYATLQRRKIALPYAVQVQLLIRKGSQNAAIPLLDSAIRYSNLKEERIRWTYLRAQLYEQQGRYAEALADYKRVRKSNTDFEMYFNAVLHIIRINQELQGSTFNKEDELFALLKDDKSLEYNDQVYYQIASIFQEKENYKDAEIHYLNSIRASTDNPYQKGVSYLRIADLNFNHSKDYLKAKQYYDSAVATLPASYKDYDLVLKKTQNLQYLTSRFQKIAHQDTLQYVARLPEAERQAKIEAIVNPPIPDETQALRNAALAPNTISGNFSGNPPERERNRSNSGAAFYFSNSTAISKGFSDFKRQWGNRKLEENWRQSIKSSYQASSQMDPDASNPTARPDSARFAVKDKTILIKEFTDSLPLTPGLLELSNQKIINAFFDIASYYQQELGDNIEAIRIYQLLLNRFPENQHQAAIYYSLYLSYSGLDNTKSADYKNLVLSKYPTSVYAKTILDPSFSIKQNELETKTLAVYNTVFGHYERKEFPKVIIEVDKALANSGKGYLSAQLDYLRAIAIGRTQPVDSLLYAFQEIKTAYDDKLIVPLVDDHVTYITKNLDAFRKRDTALVDFDPNEPPFGRSALPASVKNIKPVVVNKGTVAPASPITPATPPAAVKTEPVQSSSPVDPPQPVVSTIKTDGLFTSASSAQYYFVIDVSDASLTLSSSRFGIGQFNRGAYSGSNLKHQLLEFDNEQLIYVGNFSTMEEAKKYASDITPQLSKIMKVPSNIYISFVASKENFDKMTSKALISRYLEFYKNNL